MSGNQNLEGLDWRALFEEMHPGFFEMPNIRSLPPDRVFEEMALDLRAESPDGEKLPAPEGVSFGCWTGDLSDLRRQVARVDETWPPFFGIKDRVYCAFAEGRLASFCILEDRGERLGLRIAGPGCVGTLPEFRRRGIGLKLVQNATEILRAEGYDISYIHFTGVAPWYAKLGYRTVLRWSGVDGILN